MIAILVILAFVAAWNIAPMLMLCTLPIPWRHKLRGCKSFANAAPARPSGAAARSTRPRRRAICAAADWVGRRIAAALGTLVGQRRQYQRRSSSPRHICRHARGPRSVLLRAGPPPRSFHARWCGWACATGPVRSPQCFGRKLTPAEVQDADTWGDETIGKAKEGWCVRRGGPLYQLYIIRKIGPLCLRVHYGHKLNHARIWGRPAMVVNISFSLVRWKGRHELHKKGRRRD